LGNVSAFFSRHWLGLLLITAAALGGLGWANYSFSTSNPGGNDFLVYYTGTRAVLYEGDSPYSDQVADRIQEQVYGRPAGEGEHQLRFVYPLYSILLFSPFAMIGDFVTARAVWMTGLQAALFLTALLTLRIIRWKPDIWLKVVYFIFALTWYHAVRGLINGNAVIWITLFVILFLLAVQSESYVLAGVLLASATIKPHLLILPVLYVAVWAASNRHWSLIGSFLITMAVLVGGGMMVIPDWIIQNLREIVRFPDYNPVLTLGELLGTWLPGIRQQIRWAPTVVLGLMLILEWWTSRKESFQRFFWTFCLTLVVSQWIGVPTDPGNFIVLFPALVIILAVWDKRWKYAGSQISAAALGLLWVGLWWLFLSTVEMTYQPVQSPVMFVPLPAFLLVGLYWVKWWIAAPIHKILERPEEQEGI
jgi:hypothetical protein